MRNIAACYSEHAIKVSDSYCSGPSAQSYLSPNLIPSIQDAITCIYKTILSTKKHLLIKLNWCSFVGQGFTISITYQNIQSKYDSSSSHQFLKPKGTSQFESCNSKVEIHWDLSHAKFNSGPEPLSGYYIVVLVDSEISLHLGDGEKFVNPSAVVEQKKIGKFHLVSRNEHFSGSASYATRARFVETGTWHDILISCERDDEEIKKGLKKRRKTDVLTVCLDKKEVIEVKRLKWNFRGNQTIFVDGLVVDMMWDVHDWLFNPEHGYAVFMFRTRSGLDSRLWLEDDKTSNTCKDRDRSGYSLLISACRNPD